MQENGKNEISAGFGPKIAYFAPPDLTQKKTKEYKRIVLVWRTCVLSTGTFGLPAQCCPVLPDLDLT
jgi:hypothetical protein